MLLAQHLLHQVAAVAQEQSAETQRPQQVQTAETDQHHRSQEHL
jgi:hypothetical protein